MIANCIQARSQKILLGSVFELDKVDLLILQYSPGHTVEKYIISYMV